MAPRIKIDSKLTYFGVDLSHMSKQISSKVSKFTINADLVLDTFYLAHNLHSNQVSTFQTIEYTRKYINLDTKRGDFTWEISIPERRFAQYQKNQN